MPKQRKNALAAVGMPLAAVSSCPRIEILGNREVVIEGCRGVAEYSEEVIRLNVAGGSLGFLGKGLEIINLCGDEARLSGILEKIEFCL